MEVVLLNNIWQDVHVFQRVVPVHVTVAGDALLAVALQHVNPHASAAQAWAVSLFVGKRTVTPSTSRHIADMPRPLRSRDVPVEWHPNLRELCLQAHEGSVPLSTSISAGIGQTSTLFVTGQRQGVITFTFHVSRRTFTHAERNADLLSDIAALIRSTR
jgi:hypothetical protein